MPVRDTAEHDCDGGPPMLTGGSMVGGYRIERELGAGGMGSVYLAAHPTLPRFDALKVLSRELSRDPDFRTRFTREADVAASLDHPQIVAVYNRGETDDGQLWIAMQFVDGTDADAALRAGTMTPARAVHIVTQVAKALDFAHSRTVVHRDIKPANFLLSGPAGPDERVLLGDFGIARALDDVGLTATGSVMATIAYAAPEVLSGMPFDGRADIYSLGCTLYRLLTGKTPYSGSNGPAATMMAHLQQPPPRVTDVVPSLPAALDQVIAVAMAKEPGHRFGSASALAAAASAALHDPSVLQNRTLLAPVPGPEVSSYPRADARSPAVSWPHSGPSPAQATPAYGPSAPAGAVPRRRRRAVVIGAVAAVTVLVAATVTVAVWPQDEPASNPAAGSGQTQTAGRAAGHRRARPRAALDLVERHPDSRKHRRERGGPRTGRHRTAQRLGNHRQSAVPWRLGAGAAAGLQRDPNRRGCGADAACPVPKNHPGQRHSGCRVVPRPERRRYFAAAAAAASGRHARARPSPSPPLESRRSTWTFGQPTNNAGAFVLDATSSAGDAVCQHGISTRGNVLIDIRQCRPPGTGDVGALITATANKVPRQQ